MKRSKPFHNGNPPNAKAIRRGETTQSAEEPTAETAKPSAPSASLNSNQHRCRPPEAPQSLSERKRLFLAVGDEVSHVNYEHWGIGVVMETMTSSVPGGTCLARIRFQDGQLRCFNNDLDNESCCYYFGLRRYWNPTHGVQVLRSKFLAMKD